MPRLIHVNGASRVGKSTLARRWADDHPGTFVLDLDILAEHVGGWRRNLSAAHDTARRLGREAATCHLRDGHDVIFPQLVTVHDRDPDASLERVACAAGATYVQVAVLVDEREHRERLAAKQPRNEVEELIQRALEDPNAGLVDKIRGHLEEYLAGRPAVIRLDTTGIDEEESYLRLREALEVA